MSDINDEVVRTLVEESPYKKTDRDVPKPRPIIPKKKSVDDQTSVDNYMLIAKALVLDNYTHNMVPRGNPELSLDDLFIVWFSKTLGHWKALVGTVYADGLYYEVTHNGNAHETYVDVYRRVAHKKISDRFAERITEELSGEVVAKEQPTEAINIQINPTN